MGTVRSTRFGLAGVLALAVALTACSANSPQLIGSQPKQIGSSGYTSPPAWPIVYSAYMELEVADVEVAVQAAAQIARDYGGYLTGGQVMDVWRVEAGAKNVEWGTLTLEVPAAQFDGAHNALLSLGKLVREDISGKPLGGASADVRGSAFSTITVHFQLAPRSTWRPWPSISWNPARTFAQASDWFVSIFTFLADIVIWIVVVGGPFVLMGWGAAALWRRLHGRR
jgi:hypothetical protein